MEMNTKLDSKEMKFRVMNYLRNDKNCLTCVPEYINGSDVFAVNRNHYVIEVEIKVSWTDLFGELKTIKYLCEGDNEITKMWNHSSFHKYDKHDTYLHSPNEKTPKYFYFAVPLNLASKALRFLNEIDFAYQKPIPYGLLLVDETKELLSQYGRGYWNPSVTEIKKAFPLCNNKFTDFERLSWKVSSFIDNIMEDYFIEKQKSDSKLPIDTRVLS